MPPSRAASLPFDLETDLERRIAADREWRAGVEWGRPRPGHPEGAVKLHIAEVLANIELLDVTPDDRARLRLAALVHDTWKRRVLPWHRNDPPNEHGYRAAAWLRCRVDDPRLIALVELHDEAFRASCAAARGDMPGADRRIGRIVERLGPELPLFLAFYWADNESGDKSPEHLDWFIAELRRRGVAAERPGLRGGVALTAARSDP